MCQKQNFVAIATFYFVHIFKLCYYVDVYNNKIFRNYMYHLFNRYQQIKKEILMEGILNAFQNMGRYYVINNVTFMLCITIYFRISA